MPAREALTHASGKSTPRNRLQMSILLLEAGSPQRKRSPKPKIEVWGGGARQDLGPTARRGYVGCSRIFASRISKRASGERLAGKITRFVWLLRAEGTSSPSCSSQCVAPPTWLQALVSSAASSAAPTPRG